MKKMMSLLLLICIFGLVGCGSNYNRDKIERVIVNEKTDNIETEMKGSFDYFYLTSNLNEGSAGYGLARDRMSNNDLSSIASTGYALSAWVIGIENGYITFEEGEKIVLGTLDTLLQMDHHHGFFYHFINIRTTIRSGYSEVSVIDTALLALGLIVVGEYFGGDILKKADQLIDSIEWPWYLNETTSQFYMSYSPETDRHSGAWNHYAEQLMMYILSAGSNNIQSENYLIMSWLLLQDYLIKGALIVHLIHPITQANTYILIMDHCLSINILNILILEILKMKMASIGMKTQLKRQNLNMGLP